MARYWTDFSEFVTGAGLPEGFTLRGDQTWTFAVVDESSEPNLSGELTGNRALRFNQIGGGNYNSMVSFDAAGQPTGNVDIIARVAAGDYTNETFGVGIRAGSGMLDWSVVQVNRSTFLVRVNGGSTDYSVSEWATWTPLYFRYRVDGERIKAVAGTSLADVQGDNPTWLLDVADPDGLASGHVGVVVRDGNNRRWVDWIGVGTGNDLAPTEAVGEDPVPVPSGFTFTASGLQLDGAWSAVSGADSYDWEIQRDDAGSWVAFESGNTATLAFQVTSGVAYGTTYRARVRTDDGGVKSDWTAYTSASTPADAFAISGQQIEAVALSWMANTGPYDIRRDETTLIAEGLTVTTFTDDDVTGGTSYTYEVREDGGAWSAPVTVAVVAGGGGVFFLKPNGGGWST